MSQGALQVPTTPPLPGATAVAAINTAIAALASISSGTAAPTLGPGAASALVKGQLWLDTTTAAANLLKMYDGTSWVTIFTFDTSAHTASPVPQTGTWTPTLAFGGASVGITYSIRVGRYQKVGNRVTVKGEIFLTSKGSSTGNATLSGFPFTAAADGSPTGNAAVCAAYASNGFTFTGQMLVSISTAGTSGLIFADSNGAITILTDAAFSNGSIISFNMTYESAT